MVHRSPFSSERDRGAAARLREALGARGLAAAVLAAPEKIFCLTGLDHWGYFAPHLLVVPRTASRCSSPARWSG